MALRPGYNIVTEPVEDTDSELGALDFLRKAAADEELPDRVTVTGLDDLLFHSEDRGTVTRILMQVLRNSASITHLSAVQFVIDGQLSPAERFQVRIERQGEPTIIDLGEIFVDEPELISPDHAIAAK